MKAPKCRFCGAEAWAHTCKRTATRALLQPKPKEAKIKPKVPRKPAAAKQKALKA